MRVGIVGFSATVCDVAYTLTHSTYHFAAASLVDGVDCGYFQEIAYPHLAPEFSQVNGGAMPFGKGLSAWLEQSPTFALGNVNTPVRLLALGSADVLQQWEWFVALSLQRKPVEYVVLPDAAHLVVKPWERMSAQQGLVDWLCFWLKSEEDPDPAKTDQYARWRELQKLQRQNSTKPQASSAPVN